MTDGSIMTSSSVQIFPYQHKLEKVTCQYIQKATLWGISQKNSVWSISVEDETLLATNEAVKWSPCVGWLTETVTKRFSPGALVLILQLPSISWNQFPWR